ncbi:hydrogenase maturation nickel metallochaperone HypA [Deltaproteobacteria bacterium TL4]
MHELSIMNGVLETVLREAEKVKATRVTGIGLKIGERSGVLLEAITFAFDVITRDTIAEGAELKLESMPLMGECPQCELQFRAENGFLMCPQGHEGAILISGQELNLEFIEVDY